MTFNSMNELKNYILTRSQVAIERAQERILMIINHFLSEYYHEFDPVVYERTYQLLRSLIKSDVKYTGDGWEAEVYFDATLLDYSMKLVNGNFVPNENGWTGEQVLTTAMTGDKPHGGYAQGTQIWNESLKILNKSTYKFLKQMLIESGVPIK